MKMFYTQWKVYVCIVICVTSCKDKNDVLNNHEESGFSESTKMKPLNDDQSRVIKEEPFALEQAQESFKKWLQIFTESNSKTLLIISETDHEKAGKLQNSLLLKGDKVVKLKKLMKDAVFVEGFNTSKNISYHGYPFYLGCFHDDYPIFIFYLGENNYISDGVLTYKLGDSSSEIFDQLEAK